MIMIDYFFLEEVAQTVNQSARDANIKPKGNLIFIIYFVAYNRSTIAFGWL
jgi:hypothetical protein